MLSTASMAKLKEGYKRDALHQNHEIYFSHLHIFSKGVFKERYHVTLTVENEHIDCLYFNHQSLPQDHLMRRWLLSLISKDVNVPARFICKRQNENERKEPCKLVHLLAVYGTLYLLCTLPTVSTSAMSSDDNSISLKFSMMRDGVTDLGMTLCPPT